MGLQNVFQKFGGVFSFEQCLEWAGKLLPDQRFHLNCFGQPSFESDLEASAPSDGSEDRNPSANCPSLAAFD